ncbi:OmpA family protein [Taibaiella lutea]|uniref:OmpA family protein n=2 Tax=Taibaiella lutea TaxID=2608001 RepID=A0A5M6CPQ6_9BACT|nr:OmpA family protein [Taibaiella lutea]
MVNNQRLLFYLYLTTFYMMSLNLCAQTKGSGAYEKAQEYLRQQQTEKAIRYFKKSLTENPAFSDAYISLGMLYCDNRQYTEAADVFRQAAQACPACSRNFAIPLARTLCRAGEYAKADAVLMAWNKPDSLNPKLKLEYDKIRMTIQYGKYAVNAKPTATPENLGPRINTKYDEYFPSIFPDDSTIIFTRRSEGVEEDFYAAKRDSCGGWFEPRNMGSPPNSPQPDGALMRSADGHYLFFMRDGVRSENGWDGGGCDIFFSYVDNDGWSEAVPFGATINTPGYEGMPSLSCDNKVMYFVSDRQGGFGGKDIWMSVFQDGLWQVPENLGPDINTPYDETAPYIAADNSTLYFTSDGHPGLGGTDIFLSKKKNNFWQTPQNMGYPFNTAYDDVSMCISPDGKKAYMASDRAGGYGAMDLYEVPLSEDIQPQPYTFVFGISYDSLTKDRLTYAQVEWRDAVTDEVLFRFQTNRGDATYMASIPLHKQYKIRVVRAGYLTYDTEITYDSSNIVHPDTLNFSLLPLDYSPPLYDTMIGRFNFLKSATVLTDTQKNQLRLMVQGFVSEPRAEFFVNGFTDDTGTPDINEQVSFARARSLGDALMSMGISESQIHIQGWADANPMVSNDSDENRLLNRRVELTVRRP